MEQPEFPQWAIANSPKLTDGRTKRSPNTKAPHTQQPNRTPTMMMMRRAAQRAANVAVRAHPERSTVAVAARFQQQRAGFATIYDVTPTPYEDINRHRSDAEQRIAQLPVVEVDGNIAVCDGGGGALGHPIEYIQLDTVKHHAVQTCKYCGVRYKQKEGSHGHHH